ncbi:MAG: hypothetical protein R2722_14330 [Tessaracoccus sp.]
MTAPIDTGSFGGSPLPVVWVPDGVASGVEQPAASSTAAKAPAITARFMESLLLALGSGTPYRAPWQGPHPHPH